MFDKNRLKGDILTKPTYSKLVQQSNNSLFINERLKKLEQSCENFSNNIKKFQCVVQILCLVQLVYSCI